MDNKEKNNHKAHEHKIPDEKAGTDHSANDASVTDKTEKMPEEVLLSKTDFDSMKIKADERDAYYDKYVRAHAEFENAKRRMEKEKIDSMRYVADSFVLDFLPIADNLETAEKYIKESKDFKAVQEGVNMIHLQIQKFLKDMGVEKIKTVGEKFDPHQHDPLETEDVKDKEEGVITAELKPGYKLNGRLLRPASVKIVKKSAT